MTFSVGDILRIGGARYRVVAIAKDSAVLCGMDTDRLSLVEDTPAAVARMLASGDAVKEDEEGFVFRADVLSPAARLEYERRLSMVREVDAAYGPDYLGLSGHAKKDEAVRIMEKYGVSKAKFWRIVRRYLQGGFKDSSLLDGRTTSTNAGKTYDYAHKPGRKPEYVETGIVPTPEMRSYMDEALRLYLSGRQPTLAKCYEAMIGEHYSESRVVNGICEYGPVAATRRPNMRQFYDYAEKNLSKEDVRKAKTSAREVRNNERLLLGDATKDAMGPGDIVEIDACEADVYLVSLVDGKQGVARPTVYFMADVYTRAIIAVSVGFTQNSVMGITNLFLNLADDKREYCSKFGVGFDDPDMWPSGILPRRVRMDRGSEMKSRELDRICTTLGIERQNVTGATGSMKGVVERSFRRMNEELSMHLEHHGLIEKRYDSDHRETAVLDRIQYTRLVIQFIMDHNQRYLPSYPVTADMRRNGVPAIPASLWKYGSGLYGAPRSIPDIQQYLYTMMLPVKARISRRGIRAEGLWYTFEDDPALRAELFAAGDRMEKFEARIDPRCVDALWYERGHKLYRAPLNPGITGNADFSEFTLEELRKARKIKGAMDAEGRLHNEELGVYSHAVNAAVVADAAAGRKERPEPGNIREGRAAERALAAAENRIEDRMPVDIAGLPGVSAGTRDAEPGPRRHYAGFSEALEDMENNA